MSASSFPNHHHHHRAGVCDPARPLQATFVFVLVQRKPNRAVWRDFSRVCGASACSANSCSGITYCSAHFALYSGSGCTWRASIVQLAAQTEKGSQPQCCTLFCLCVSNALRSGSVALNRRANQTMGCCTAQKHRPHSTSSTRQPRRCSARRCVHAQKLNAPSGMLRHLPSPCSATHVTHIPRTHSYAAWLGACVCSSAILLA